MRIAIWCREVDWKKRELEISCETIEEARKLNNVGMYNAVTKYIRILDTDEDQSLPGYELHTMEEINHNTKN